MAKLRERNSNFINDASSLEEVDLKEIVQKKLDFFIDNKENKVFKNLKDETYYKNLKKDIEENQGIENPVICFENGTLVEGHSRIQVLRELVKEGKLPKAYNVPTIIFKGTKEEGTKRLILGNLNRFEIDPNTRTLLFARVYPGYFDPENDTKHKGGGTVPPEQAFSRRDISIETGLPEDTLKKDKQLLKKAMEKTKKPLEKLEPQDLKEVREEKNQQRRAKTQAKKEATSTKTPSPGAKEPSKKEVKPLRPYEMTTKGRELSRKYEYPKGRVGTPSHNQAIEKQFEKFKKESVSTVFGYYEIYNFLTDGKSFDDFIEMIRRERGL